MAYHLYIINKSDGPFKVPFKEGTPYDVQVKVNGVVQVSGRILIPSDVVEYIDRSRLDYHTMKREIRVIEKKVSVPRVGTEPKRGSVSKKKKRKASIKIEKKEAE